MTEGMRIFRRSLKLKRKGIPAYSGNAQQICEQIVADCWNGRFFQTGGANFTQFWTRDVGWCAEALVELGHGERVAATLQYALSVFVKSGGIKTTITPSGKAFDFPSPAVDSLPWLMHSLVHLGDKGRVVVEEYRNFLDKEVEKFVTLFVDSEGMVKKGNFSSIKDFAVRDRSCYDMCMLGLLSKSLTALGMDNPLVAFDYEKIIVSQYWNGSYFYDDMSHKDYVAADAQIFPFWLGVVTDGGKLASVVKAMRDAGLDAPLPVRYTSEAAPVRFIWQEKMMKGYELDAVWMHIGPLFIALVLRVDEQLGEEYKKKYAHFIEMHKNYLEVVDGDMKPFRTAFYHADVGMLWAVNYLTHGGS